jgi:hypothetical protein
VWPRSLSAIRQDPRTPPAPSRPPLRQHYPEWDCRSKERGSVENTCVLALQHVQAACKEHNSNATILARCRKREQSRVLWTRVYLSRVALWFFELPFGSLSLRKREQSRGRWTRIYLIYRVRRKTARVRPRSSPSRQRRCRLVTRGE